MRRPTRTRRLGFAATVSLLAFLMVAIAGVRSFWNCDLWQFMINGKGQAYFLYSGRAGFVCRSGEAMPTEYSGHTHTVVEPNRYGALQSLWGFEVHYGVDSARQHDGPVFEFCAPLWPLLLVLLIIPARWLIARPAGSPAFPVVSKQP